MKFKTESERDQALAALPVDPPTGVNVDKWLLDLDSKMKEIEEAEIDSTEAVEEEVASDDGSSEMMNRQYDRKEAESQRIMSEDKQRIKNLEEQLESAKRTVIKDNSKDEIQKIRGEIDGIIDDLDKKTDAFDEDYIKKLKRQTVLTYRLSSLTEKRQEDRDKEHQLEIQKLKNEQNLKTESEEKRTAKKAYIKNIEDLRAKNPELQGLSYESMDDEYADFSLKIASAYYGEGGLSKKQDESDAQIEIAMQKYVEGTPFLLEKVSSQRIKEPKGLKQYLLLSELNAMDQGFVMHKATGEWKPYLNAAGKQVSFLNFEDVYDHWKKTKGIKAKELIEQQRVTEKNMMAAINRRANVRELDTEHRNQDVGEMSEARAYELIENLKPELIAEYGRKNINHPYIIEANKALTKLGQPLITADSL